MEETEKCFPLGVAQTRWRFKLPYDIELTKCVVEFNYSKTIKFVPSIVICNSRYPFIEYKPNCFSGNTLELDLCRGHSLPLWRCLYGDIYIVLDFSDKVFEPSLMITFQKAKGAKFIELSKQELEMYWVPIARRLLFQNAACTVVNRVFNWQTTEFYIYVEKDGNIRYHELHLFPNNSAALLVPMPDEKVKVFVEKETKQTLPRNIIAQKIFNQLIDFYSLSKNFHNPVIYGSMQIVFEHYKDYIEFASKIDSYNTNYIDQ